MIPKLARPVRIQRRRIKRRNDRGYGRVYEAKARITKRRDGYRCTKCGWQPKKRFRWLLHSHHKHRVIRGGRHTGENIKTLCLECHVREHPNNPFMRVAFAKQLKLIRQLKRRQA